MIGPISAALAVRSQRKAFDAEAEIREILADMRELNALQAEYRDWMKQPTLRKIGGRWFAEVEYPPSVPRVKRSHPK